MSDMIEKLFDSIDNKNPEAFVSFLSPGCTFKFGNLPAVTGTEQIRDFVSGFFDSIASLSHTIKDSWNVEDGVICHGDVSYTRKDGSVLTVPFANILKSDSGGIADYMIFADTSQLYS